MRKVKKALILFVAVILTACGAGASTWQEHYDLGMRYLTEGNYEDAVLAFTAAIEIDDKLPDAFVGRGDAFVMWAETVSDVMEEKIELALTDFLYAINIDNKNVDTYLKAADAYLMIGDNDAAKALLEEGFDRTKDSRLQEKLDSMLQDTSPLEVRKEGGLYYVSLTDPNLQGTYICNRSDSEENDEEFNWEVRFINGEDVFSVSTTWWTFGPDMDVPYTLYDMQTSTWRNYHLEDDASLYIDGNTITWGFTVPDDFNLENAEKAVKIIRNCETGFNSKIEADIILVN